MTLKENQSLRDWSARKMGWTEKQYGPDWCYYLNTTYDRGDGYFIESRIRITDWQPDLPETGQIWMLVERMKQSHTLFLSNGHGAGGDYHASFCTEHGCSEAFDDDPCIAILLAAGKTEGE